VEAEGEQSFCLTYLSAHALRDGDRQSGLGFTLARRPADLQPTEAGLEAAHNARVLLGAAPCPTGRYTLVLIPQVAAAFLAAIAGALSADAVQKGRSVFQGRLGQQIASSDFGLFDDGLAEGGLSSSAFDGEGVACRRTALLEDGFLRSYLYDTYTARKAGAGAVSTGNAGRGSYRSLPVVAGTNVILDGGEGDLQALLGRVGHGLLVESVAGIHSGVNPSTGEISVGVVGRVIENGVPVRPVREVTMATDFLSFLRELADRASDDRWIPLYGSVRTPSVAVRDVAVSGT
jgi:PmbA protein